MRVRSLLVLGIVLLFGTAAFAQDYAKIEVPLNYSYMRFNPENSHIISGLSLNGGGGGWQSTLIIGLESKGTSRAMPASTGPSFPCNR